MSAEWMTLPEVRKFLRCRESKIRSWIASGRLSAINLSDGERPRYRIRKSDLDDFLTTRAVRPESRPARREKRERPAGYVEYV